MEAGDVAPGLTLPDHPLVGVLIGASPFIAFAIYRLATGTLGSGRGAEQGSFYGQRFESRRRLGERTVLVKASSSFFASRYRAERPKPASGLRYA